MGIELARAMDERQTRWERGLWCQWFDAARAAGLSDGEAARFASDKDEDLREVEARIGELRRRMVALVKLGETSPPPAVLDAGQPE